METIHRGLHAFGDQRYRREPLVGAQLSQFFTSKEFASIRFQIRRWEFLGAWVYPAAKGG